MVLLDRVSGADAGVFKITDVLGFTVSYVHLKVKRKVEEGSRCWKKAPDGFIENLPKRDTFLKNEVSPIFSRHLSR